MLTLDDATKKELLTDLVPAVQEATDVNRRAIKKIVRKIVADCFEDTERKTFHEYTGKTINNIIDMVNRETLLNLCVHAIGMPPGHTTHPDFLFGTAVTQLAYAYKDDSLCRPAGRGSGVSQGYHKEMWEMHRLKTLIHDMYHEWHCEAAGALLARQSLEQEEKAQAEAPAKVDDPTYARVVFNEHGTKFKAVEPIPLDPNLKKAVDALLNQASQGAITNADYYTDHIKSLNDQVIDALGALNDARSAINDQASAPQPVTVDGSTLTYKVVMRKAKDLFKDAKGRTSTKLDFDVETLVWYDASGNEVRHPACPEIDPHYKFRMHHIIKYLTAKKFRQHTWSHGHTGTGKTTFIEQVEARLGFPVERLNLDSNMERADVVGNVDIVVKDGAPSSVFTEGLLPVAMQQPMTFILDELDAGRPDMLFVLQRALENKGLTLTEDAGRLVKPHPLFSFAATANSRGQGDEHGWYSGVRPMNLAFLNRFGAFIEVNYMDEDDELQFIKDAYPKLNVVMAEQFARFAQLIRGAFMNGEISQTLSPRNLHAMAQYYMHFNTFMPHIEAVDEVIETCVSDAAPADNQQHIRELANRVFAGGL